MSKPSVTTRVVMNARSRGVRVLTRKQWGTDLENVYQWRRKNKPHTLIPGKPADTLWQHITVTVPSGDFRADCRLVERIGFDRFETGCSYNFMVDMTTGRVGVGMPLDAKGAHTLNDKRIPGYSFDQNAVSIGIAMVGMPDTPLTPAAVTALSRLIAALIDERVLTIGHDYVPHSLVAAKDCPCDPTRNRMPKIARLARVGGADE